MNNKLWISALTTVGAAAGYLAFVRPRLMNLGATDEEIRRRMLGDQLIDAPTYVTTRAITIDTSADNIWPWLAQMGEHRGGLYSWEFLDRLLGRKFHSPHRILPRYQNLDVGDELDRDGHIVVHAIEPGEAVVLGPANNFEDIDARWTLQLVETSETTTRLVSRVCAKFDLTSPRALLFLAVADPLQLLFERKFLREIKEHAEGHAKQWPPETPITIH